jgi:glutaredoxin-related protein
MMVVDKMNHMMMRLDIVERVDSSLHVDHMIDIEDKWMVLDNRKKEKKLDVHKHVVFDNQQVVENKEDKRRYHMGDKRVKKEAVVDIEVGFHIVIDIAHSLDTFVQYTTNCNHTLHITCTR